ncbi:hypothetical protein GCM10023093_04230 [Nemorincola caseinilytica]|uniref:Uncharacterized protein n=1 Tax=Nemorincola caseinilytica TaxID=2054315 RepID=A0ABP8N6J5_9BACT
MCIYGIPYADMQQCDNGITALTAFKVDVEVKKREDEDVYTYLCYSIYLCMYMFCGK